MVRLLENKWIRELLFFSLLFIFMVLNDREGLINPHEFRDGFFVFFMLYLHIQFQRFLILPFFVAGRYFLYGVMAIFTVFLFGTAAYFIDSWLSTVGWYDEAIINHQQLYLYYVLCCLICLIILLFVFFIIGYYSQQRKEINNQILMKDMELNLLRSQLNPHFLFNSLNNLYGISLEKPAEVPEKIMHMSRIMRYQLELSKKKYVSLQEDLDFITDYVAIEADRVSERCEVTMTAIAATPVLQQYEIAPMILISFVENAFKHYHIPPGAGKGYIHINFSMEQSRLMLHICNSANEDNVNPNSTQVGIANTKKRLMILYPRKYQITIDHQVLSYELNFSLELGKSDLLL
ncbi:hypothetical protein HDF26_002175 [Pedobacter cryoconitis]|uniref:Signal transduction histidine kinase internal region domain-containing protein n=1 Tax=Pedobacter cryoconitis TaxID=188932 RepID=A0A7W8ZJU5_9SPHI|nr:histidine kinase [Pedobacter cryoconitis]MBB5635098.1 hypothetical protein [Pedobacter cryoconitis]MBB6271718.1 hypothetical protein [Pedobacter cryoconitis]